MSELVFDRFVLDVDRRLLLCDGQPVDAQPLVFDLLTVLARRPRKVVSRTELLALVWRSSAVSESVVARAIMKARRALRDDAQEPVLLRTVQRVGYMLQADVQARASAAAGLLQPVPDEAPAGRLALLPIEDLTGLPALGWAGHGLMRLLHQWVSGTGLISLVPLSDVLDASQRREEGEDAMAQVCASTGAAEAVRCQLTWQNDVFTLRGWRGQQAPGQPVFKATDADVLELTRRLADALCCQDTRVSATGADAFWQAQMASVARLQAAGQPAQALALLERSLPEVGSSLQLELLKARLLYECARFDELLQQVDRLLATPEPDLPLLVRIELLDLRGDGLHQHNRLEEAMASFQQALALSRQEPRAHAMRPDILGRAARVAARQLQASAAIGLAELAVEEARRLKQPDMQMRAALWLCGVLSQLDQRQRAQAAVTQAIELGQRSGRAEYEARAWRYLSVQQNTERRNGAARQSIQRSIALCLRCGNAYELFWSRMTELLICTEAGWFEAAQRCRSELAGRPDLPGTQRDFLALVGAALDWRLGRDEVAIEAMRALTQAREGPMDNSTMNAHAELVLMHLHRGHLDQAQADLAAMADHALAGYVERRQAALALARGDRPGAIHLLRQVWRSGRAEGGEGFLMTVDLTWLLLEDAPLRFDDAELESLFAHVLDLADEAAEVRLVKAAYLLRQRPDAHSRAGWDEAVAQAPVLQRRCPMMLTPSYREAWAARTPPRLRELLSRVCW